MKEFSREAEQIMQETEKSPPVRAGIFLLFRNKADRNQQLW